MKQVSVVAGMGLLLIAGCADPSRNGSELPNAPDIIALAPPIQQPPGCVFKTATDAARDYFKVNTDKKAATDALSLAAGLAVGSTGRNDALFTVLGLVAKVGGDPALSNAASLGATVVMESVDCGGSGWIVTDKQSLSQVLASALTDGSGQFAIRGLVADEGSVIAESGNFAFGINNGVDWLGVGRVAVYLGDVSGENVNFGVNKVQNVVYREGLISDGSPAPNFTTDDQFAAEFCLGLSVVGSNRVGRSRGVSEFTVLQEEGANLTDYTCGAGGIPPSASVAVERASSSPLARLVSRVASVFKPTPLQAMMFVPPWSGSTGGTCLVRCTDFAVVNVQSVNLLANTPPNPHLNQTFTYDVAACADRACDASPTPGVPLENAVLTITLVGNFGSPVTMSGTGCPVANGNLSCTLTTDETGHAIFQVSINKTGQYTLVTSASYPGVTVQPVPTDKFNVIP